MSLEKTIQLTKLNPWQPITDKPTLKCLGKALEEANEYGSALARCLIQGVDEVEPTTGKPNRQWLEEEMADVYATLYLVARKLKLNGEFIEERMARKIRPLRDWQDSL